LKARSVSENTVGVDRYRGLAAKRLNNASLRHAYDGVPLGISSPPAAGPHQHVDERGIVLAFRYVGERGRGE